MATDREFQEVIARCVSVMVCYHNDKRSSRARAAMTADVRAIAEWVLMLCLSAGELDRDLFKRVEEGLVMRYGRIPGNRLYGDFVGAFEGADRPAGSSRTGNGVQQA